MITTGDTIRNRYELKQVLGRGGMGVVYQAFDRQMRRDVAIKTLHDGASKVVLDLFYRECSVLAGMVHPNIIEIFDMGDFEEDGIQKPYFVMSLLPGKTLHDLIYHSDEPLSVDELIDVTRQTCRGLQAAHDRNILHRDVKPRNIFVMADFSVKLIDFGVAHLLESQSSTGIKGTPNYMAPEQIRMRPLCAGTDIFALSVLIYEGFARQHPFKRTTEQETVNAILNFTPPLISEVNRAVSRSIAQVINKGMAKEPLLRFATASEFSESLRKASRNEPIRAFSATGIEIRISRARKYFDQGDFEFASELIKELQAEGQSVPAVEELQNQLETAIRRRNAEALLDSAAKYFKAEEHSLALRKIREILELDPTNLDALNLKSKIDKLESDRKLNELLDDASQNLARASFRKAREVLQEALRIRADDIRVRQLLHEVDLKQKEFLRQRQEQEKLYQMSQEAWVTGDISVALKNLQQLAELSHRSSEPADRIAEYNDFYNLVRREHDLLLKAIDNARAHVEEGDLPAALVLCRQFLSKYPSHSGFMGLQLQIEDRQHQEKIAFIEATRGEIAEEPNPDRRFVLAEQALRRFPDDPDLQEQLIRVREHQHQVNSVLDSARGYEDAGDFDRALQEWNNLRNIYAEYPDLDREIERIGALYTHARARAKATWVGEIQASYETGDYGHAAELIASATAEFPGDDDLSELGERIQRGVDRRTRAQDLINEGQDLAARRRFVQALDKFREAFELSKRDQGLQNSVLDGLEKGAADSVDFDWRSAESFLKQLWEFKPDRAVPKDLRSKLFARQRDEVVNLCLIEVQQLETAGHLEQALEKIEAGVSTYPDEPRLIERRGIVEGALQELQRRQARDRDLNELRNLEQNAQNVGDAAQLGSLLELAQLVIDRYPGDEQLQAVSARLAELLGSVQKIRDCISKDKDGVAKALSLCNECLVRYPDHLVFRALKSETEDHQRHIVSALLDEVDQNLAGEHILEKRAGILEQALRRYPDEAYLQQALNLIRDEQKLVGSIVAKARADEQSHRYVAALEHWTSLRTVYRYYPGLEEEIERVTRLHDQARAEAKACWVKQIQQALEGPELRKAGELLRAASTEYAGEPEWEDLGNRLRQETERRSQAEQLLAQAQKLMEDSHPAEGLEKLTQAYELGRPDVLFRKTVLDLFVKYARLLANSDWQSAGAFLERAQTLDGGYTLPKDLLARILARKRDALVDELVAEIQQLKAAGNLHGALQKVEEGTSIYPQEKRLLAERKLLHNSLQEIENQRAREQAINDLQALDQETRTIANPAELKKLQETVRGIAVKYSRDKNVKPIADELNQRLKCIEDVHSRVAVEDLSGALTVCTSHLAKHPTCVPLQNLKTEIEDRQRQITTAAIEEVARQLADEPDLDNRAVILENALRHSPGERYFQEELNVVRDQQKLVHSIVAKAGELEKAGQYGNASEQWKSLRTIYRNYPGLEEQIQKLDEIERQARASEKARAVEQIERFLTSGDLISAADLLDVSRKQYDDTFQVSADQLCMLLERKLEVQNLLAEARTLVDTDSPAARALLERISALDPSFAIPSDLQNQLADRERDHFVQLCLAAARESEANNDLGPALEKIETALAKYPKERRLTQARDSLKARAEQAAVRQETRDRDLQELRQLKTKAEVISASDELAVLCERAENIAAKYFSDSEIQALATGFAQLKGSPDLAARPVIELEHKTPETDNPELPSEKKPSHIFEPSNRNQFLVFAAIGIFVIGSLIFLFLHFRHPDAATQAQKGARTAPIATEQPQPPATEPEPKPAPPQPGPTQSVGTRAAATDSTVHEPGKLRVDANQEEVRVFVNGKYRGLTKAGLLILQLDSGAYDVRVEKKGYQTPPLQSTVIAERQTRRLRFELTLDPRNALAIQPSPTTVPTPRSRPIDIPPPDLGPAPGISTPTIPLPPNITVDPRQIEAGDWEKVKNSRNIQELEAFRNAHKNGSHFEEAGKGIEQLRRESVTEAERKNSDEITANKTAIRSLVQQYAAAYSNQDWAALKAVWPDAPIDKIKRSFGRSRSVFMQLNTGDPTVSGNSGTVSARGFLKIDSSPPTTLVIYFRLSKDSHWRIAEVNGSK